MSDTILEVCGLQKRYPAFILQDVSFCLQRGRIMGFIGRNGAGKTTTLKSILGLVHPDGGEIRYFGIDFAAHEEEIKQQIGYAAGGVSYYQRRRIREIAAVTASFYSQWDDAAYRRHLQRFQLEESKRLLELSEGMKVKFHLALALSHHARLLILDEPTSGLDPVSREELLEIFLELAEEGVSILFSTHITSDLEKCADDIAYIQKGRLLAVKPIGEFQNDYRLLVREGPLSSEQEALVLGRCRQKAGDTLLIRREDAGRFAGMPCRQPELEEIMVHLEKEGAEQ